MSAFVTRAWLIIALATSACNWNVGTLEVRLVKTSNADNDPLAKNLIKALRIRVEGDGMSAMETEISIRVGGAGVLEDVPVGGGRVITVEGLDTSNNVQSRGVSTPLEVKSGTNLVYLYISRVGMFSSPPWGALEDEWTGKYATRMTDSRVFHATTSLHNHEVLVSGGVLAPDPNDPLARVDMALPTAQRFDASAAAFLKESGQRMLAERGRAFHTAHLLPDSGLVLLIGGEPIDNDQTAEYYNADDRSFEDTGDMKTSRTRHVSAAVDGGESGILIAGGLDSVGDPLGSIELFRNGSFEQPSGSISALRAGSAAVAVPGGMLVTGGWSRLEAGVREASNQADLIMLDGSVRVTSFRLGHARAEHTAVVIDDPGGSPTVLVCGGLAADGYTVESTCELISIDQDPPQVQDLGGVTCRRWLHTATQLVLEGKPAVMLAGGFTGTGAAYQADKSALLIKDVLGSGGYELLPMVSRRAGHTATLLANGMIVFIGGVSAVEAPLVQMAEIDYEIYNPR